MNNTGMEETQVVIVGAGPVGLALALDLAQRGVASVIVERSPAEAQTLPSKAGTLNERSLELCRRWGIAEEVREWGCPADYPRDNVYLTSLVNGHLIGRSEVPSAVERAETPVSPEVLRKCPQFILDPILERAALATGLVELRRECTVTDFVDDGSRVTVYYTTSTGDERGIQCQYLVGCDGAGSMVRRGLGIAFEGPTLDYSLTVIVDIEHLENHHPHGRAERFLFMGPDGVWCNATSMDYGRYWRFTLLGFTDEPSLTEDEAEARVLRAMGTDQIPYKLLGVAPWRRSQCVAESFGEGRVLLAGDAAHTTSPTGGHGLNTGLGDVSDLGWMLHAQIEGWGGPELLSAYTGERRPVAIRNGAASTSNYSKWVSAIDYSLVMDDTPAGEASRREIGRRLVESLHGEWHSQGVGLGYRYDTSPLVVPDGTAPTPDEVSDYVQTARPGHRAPHVYLADGRSTLDLFGEGFVLLSLGGDAVESQSFVAAAANCGLPLTVHKLDDTAVARAYGSDLVLVRPDGHVAWRAGSRTAVNDPAEILQIVRGARVPSRDDVFEASFDEFAELGIEVT